MRRVLAAFLLLAPAAAGAASAGLCAASETSFFSCQTAGKKWIGLCGSATGAVQYRFGAPGRIELQYPADPADAVSSLHLTHYARFDADRSELTFSNQGVGYALFAYREHGKQSAGVRVAIAGGKEREIACAGRIVSHLPRLRGVLRCAPDNALSLGECD